MPEQLRITTATREDVDLMVEWAAREGWNPGLDDAAAFRAADPEGFLVGRIGEEPVSCISVVGYPGGFGFLGFYIVVPERRGRGHGIATWRACSASASAPSGWTAWSTSRPATAVRASSSRTATSASAARCRSRRPTTHGSIPSSRA